MIEKVKALSAAISDMYDSIVSLLEQDTDTPLTPELGKEIYHLGFVCEELSVLISESEDELPEWEDDEDEF